MNAAQEYAVCGLLARCERLAVLDRQDDDTPTTS